VKTNSRCSQPGRYDCVRTVLHIEEVQESQSSSKWSECCGVIFSTTIPSNVSKDLSKCASMYAKHKESNAKSKLGDVGCGSCLNVARSNQKSDIDLKSNGFSKHHPHKNVGDQSCSWGTPFSPSNVLPSNQKQRVTKIES